MSDDTVHWGCPDLQCPDRIEPNAITAITHGVARKAAEKLNENRTVVGTQGHALAERLGRHTDDMGSDLDETAKTLADALWEPEVQARLRARMAAEGVVLGLLEGRITSRQNAWLKKWFKQFGHREPTWDEVNRRDSVLDNMAADVAAEVYDADPLEVRRELDHLRGKHIKANPHAR